MSKSITTLLTFLSRLSSSYGNPTEPGLTRSQCSAATHGGGAVKLPVLLKLVLEDHQHEPLRLLPVLVKPRKTAQQCTGGIGGVACCPWFNTCGEIGLCTTAGAWWFAIGRECGLQRYIWNNSMYWLLDAWITANLIIWHYLLHSFQVVRIISYQHQLVGAVNLLAAPTCWCG